MDGAPRGFYIFRNGFIAILGLMHFSASASPISVQQIGVDRFGKFLAHEVSEEISVNPALRVGEETEDGWKLVILTSGGDEATFFSVVLVRKRFEEIFDQYVFAFNGICAAQRLRFCAREIVANVQEPIAQFETDWRDLSEPDAEGGRTGDAVTGG